MRCLFSLLCVFNSVLACVVIAATPSVDRPKLPGPEQPPQLAPTKVDLSGVWECAAEHYTGHVVVLANKDGSYQVLWVVQVDSDLKTPFGVVKTHKTTQYVGCALRRGDSLFVAWIAGDVPDMAVYRISPTEITGNGETWRKMRLSKD